MDRFAHYAWPFFDERHAKLAAQADAWARNNLGHAHGEEGNPPFGAGADAICRRLVQDLGCAGYLNYAVTETPDVRSIALLREVFAYHAGLADFAFVMQGLGSGAIALAGSDELKRKYLPAAARGDAIAAFALSEPDAGSDVQAMSTRARRSGSGWVLEGTKTWISNGGIADFYVTFAKADEGITAFVVDAKDVDATERIDIVAPHPMALLKYRGARAELLGEPARASSSRCATWISSAPRSPPRRSALRAARSTRRSRTPGGGASSGRRSAISSSPRRSSPTWPRRSTRARSSLIARAGCATRVKCASHAKRRWRKCTPPRPRNRWSTTRSRSWAASA